MLLVGCVEEKFENTNPNKGGIVLNLVVGDLETKATKDGLDSLNENIIDSKLDLFFYDETTLEVKKEVLQALRSGTLVQIQTNPNDIENIFGTLASGAKCGILVVSNFTGTYEGTPGSRTITEIKSSLIPKPSWDDVPQTNFIMVGESRLTLNNAQGSTPVYATIDMKRVAAKITFALTVADNAASGTDAWVPDTKNMSIYMVYAMHKAYLGAEPQHMPALESTTYELGPVVSTKSPYSEYKLVSTGQTTSRTRTVGETSTTVNAVVYSTSEDGNGKPFYTYPSTWDTGSAMEPYLKLIIPWKYNKVTRKYYYKIPFPGNELLANHWYHISIDVQILGTEEADPPEVEVHYAIADWGGAIDESQEADEIDSITSVPAEVITTRYLTVSTTEYVLYDQDDLRIPIQSSHDVEVVGFTVVSNAYQTAHDIDANYIGTNPKVYNPFTTTVSDDIIAVRPDYSAATPSAVQHAFTYNDDSDAQGWSVMVEDRDYVVFHHELNRDLSTSDYDVAPYTIRLRVRHKTDPDGYHADVTIEQRPSIIIRAVPNSGDNANYGYAFVNGGQNNGSSYGANWTRTGRFGSYTYSSTDGSWTGYPHYERSNNSPSAWNNWTYYLGSAPSTVSASNNNANKNMYIIETSVLPTTGEIANYMLGDPRTRTVDNLGQDWSQSKPSVDGGNRKITNYYPAGDASYDNFIAPKLRAASSYGATYLVTFENARRRCASYQEDGLPAGRWRLPTVAEIAYLSLLNTDGKIMRLLGSQTREDEDTSEYWCNSGYVTVYNGANSDWSSNGYRVPAPVIGTSFNSTDTKYIRCVYDEWYWEGTAHATLTNKGTFTWGDEARNDVRMKE